MVRIHVTVTDDLKAFIEAEAAAGGFATSADYVVPLLRKARQQRTQEELEGKLIEGLNSGTPVVAAPEFWRQFKDRLNYGSSSSSDEPYSER